MSMPRVKSRVTGVHKPKGYSADGELSDHEVLMMAWDLDERLGIRENPMKKMAHLDVPELTPEPQRDGEDLIP